MAREDSTDHNSTSATPMHPNPTGEEELPAKRIKLDAGAETDSSNRDAVERKKGTAPIKNEYALARAAFVS